MKTENIIVKLFTEFPLEQQKPNGILEIARCRLLEQQTMLDEMAALLWDYDKLKADDALAKYHAMKGTRDD